MGPTRRRERRAQAVRIARATFDGFLQSDLMPAGVQASSAIWAAAFLAAPAVLPCAQAVVQYSYIRKYYPRLVEMTIWSDRALFLVLSCGAMGIISVVMWDTLFPARRDVFVLGPLPIDDRVRSAGRLGGLLMLFALFAAALNAIPALLFPAGSSPGVLAMPRSAVAHLVAALAADAFVFFGLTALQGFLLVATTRRIADRIAPVLQTAVVIVLLLTLLFLAPLRGAMRVALEGTRADAPILRWFPIAWFVGLSE